MARLNYFKNKPKAIPINTQAYLDRLGISAAQPDLRFLRTIHRSHLLKIPFENLDVHYGQKIILDIDKIFAKIINQKRGGVGFELNGLFYHLLSKLGYDAHILSCHVFQDGSYSPDFEHMVILVNLDGDQYLCDVGFGGLITIPKKLTLRQAQLDYTLYYKFEKNPDDEWILMSSKDNSVFQSVYKFVLEPRELIQFIPRCNQLQDLPDSKWKKAKFISQQFHEGRITLTDRLLTKQLFGETQQKHILNEDEFHTKLKEHFDIDFKELINQKFD
ncbi:MAG: arylamine N-acetyltransferase [Cyclobacteriaceae bacterium]